MHKTGTTAIQSALAGFDDGRTRMARLGAQNHSIPMLTVFAADPTRYHVWVRQGLPPEEVLRRRDIYRAKLDAELSLSRDQLVISGEEMSLMRATSVAAMIAGWTASVVGSHDYERENLRLSATVLAIASQQVEPNLRSVTVVDWALHKRWIGIGGAERAMLAACLLANVNREIPVDIELLAKPEDIHQAISWGLSVRLCRRLTGLAPQLFSSAELALADGQLVLTLAPVIVPLATEVVEKDLKLLAEHLSLKPVIVQRAL